jgi:hypothetical protein
MKSAAESRIIGGMNPQAVGLRVAAVIFAIFAIGHIVRLFNHAKVVVGTVEIPMSVSWIALIVAGGLCVWMWKLSGTK